jgi:hypothetical protein
MQVRSPAFYNKDLTSRIPVPLLSQQCLGGKYQIELTGCFNCPAGMCSWAGAAVCHKVSALITISCSQPAMLDTRFGDLHFGPDGISIYENYFEAGNLSVSDGTATVASRRIPRGIQIWTGDDGGGGVGAGSKASTVRCWRT